MKHHVRHISHVLRLNDFIESCEEKKKKSSSLVSESEGTAATVTAGAITAITPFTPTQKLLARRIKNYNSNLKLISSKLKYDEILKSGHMKEVIELCDVESLHVSKTKHRFHFDNNQIS